MSDPFRRIAEFYDDRVAEYGHDPRAADYSGPGPQLTKFAVLGAVTDLAGRSVLDVGCGLGDWAGYLEETTAHVRYTGIDLSPAMVEGARRQRPGIDVRQANILDDEVGGPYDVVAANGIFYLLGEDAPALLRRIVERMYALSSVATAFTSLSTWGPVDEGEFAADPLEVVAFCRTLTPWVALRHDYHRRDFAVYLYRQRQQ